MMSLKPVKQIKFYIQDVEYVVKACEVTPETSLNDYLRKVLYMTGTKSMCYEGGCGACVVCVQIRDPTSGKQVILAVNSCLVSIFSCDGWKIYTVETLGNKKTNYHIIQKRLALFNGTQCGFCSPGMVMNMFALWQKEHLTMKEVEDSFSGNLCRCTGYRSILAAFKSLCDDADEKVLGELPDIEEFRRCTSKCQIKCTNSCSKMEPFVCQIGKSIWVKVYTLKDLQFAIRKYGNVPYMLVAGNTARGVYNTSISNIEAFFEISEVKELVSYKLGSESLTLGANMTLTNTINLFYEIAKDSKFSYLKKLADHIDLVANVPVRNIGTLAGNLMTKYQHNEFPSDIFLIFETVGAKLAIVDLNDVVNEMSPKDFLNYNMKNKILRSISLPTMDDSYKYESYKIMIRAQNAHAQVNAGFLAKLDGSGTVLKIRIVYGCINADFVHATATENYLKGKKLFDNTTLQGAYKQLDKELNPDYVLPDPKPEFRKQLAIALFYKYVLSITPDGVLSPRNKSGGKKFDRPVSTGAQEYGTNKSLYPMTQPVVKLEAFAQTSGEAKFIYDLPDLPYQLHAALVVAKARPRSIIRSVDASKALKMEGVVAFYDKSDIPGKNTFTPEILQFTKYEELFCSGTVLFHSQPIGVIVAVTHNLAQKAADMVEISYSEGKEKPLYTIRQILNANATHKIIHEKTISPKRKGTDIKRVIKGTMDISWQYHFNMETQCCGVIPTENGFDIFPSTQWMDLAQAAASVALDVPANRFNVIVKRVGGAYGSKLSRNAIVSTAAALAAYKLNRPVKLWMPLKTNMMVIGKRFPCSANYEVGVDNEGTVQYLNYTFYSDFGSDGGNENVMDDLLNTIRASYENGTWSINANSTRSDCHTGARARAPGSLEGITMTEVIMEHISYELDLDPLDVRIANIKSKGEQKLLYFVEEFKKWSEVEKRKEDVGTFNARNRWVKRGISVVPMSYVLAYFGAWSVIVCIYHTDGTVAISHGGIEMGQGINTKAAQVCAYTLGIPLEYVTVKASNNLVAANSFLTGGSMGTDAICYAVSKASEKLVERIKPYREKMKGAEWREIISKCYFDNVDLTATFMFSKETADKEGYTIYGVCAAEIELDVLTGVHQILRVDLLEDTGRSLSPLIDIGQVEGAFMMGVGYWTTEEIIMNDDGEILTNRTWNYKPPGAKDIPLDFRVKFPKNGSNPQGVLNSKTTSEPPLTLSLSVPLAIRNAVAAARVEADKTKPLWYPFDGPSTIENTFLNSLHNYKNYVL